MVAPVEDLAGPVMAAYQALPEALRQTLQHKMIWIAGADILGDRAALAAWLADFDPDTREVLQQGILFFIRLELLRNNS